MKDATKPTAPGPLFGWWQLAALATLLAVGWGVFFFGAGMPQVLAWLALQMLPFAAVLLAVVAGVRAVARRIRRRGVARPGNERIAARRLRQSPRHPTKGERPVELPCCTTRGAGTCCRAYHRWPCSTW